MKFDFLEIKMSFYNAKIIELIIELYYKIILSYPNVR